MSTIDARVDQLYEMFKGFPAKSPVVRYGQNNDAFVLYIFEVLFQSYHGKRKLNYDDSSHRELVCQHVVPPPDDSIDIFFEEHDVDENAYHVVQVRNCVLEPKEIEDCFTLMENSVKRYLKRPKDVNNNLRNVIGNSDFGSTYRNSVTYYVVHRGNINYTRHQKPNQIIISTNELELLDQGGQNMNVPFASFEIDNASNFIVNNFISKGSDVSIQTDLPQSLLCNFNGYDLARLNNKYANTLLGRNILYGQNLRETLGRNSKTFDKMYETIDKEPGLFLYYNNGVTIISSSFDAKKNMTSETINVKDFSIINGAQTTSTLGSYLRNAEINNALEKIENLKQVFVLTKIYQINFKLNNHEEISERIKIFSNTQTPLSSRDMVSIRSEQIQLKNKLFDSEPFVFVNIKKGVEPPSYPKTYPHQRISNEVLAQLALCGFLFKPFTAKDKKAKIFDNESTDAVLLNKVYHDLFDIKDGILFKKSNGQVDELLFVYRLHEDAKKMQKSFLKEQLSSVSQGLGKDDLERSHKESRLLLVRRNMEVTNVCLFWNITTYFEFKSRFDNYIGGNNDSLVFNYKKYYDDKSFRETVARKFVQVFYSKTVEIIRRHSGQENVSNWLRAEKNEKIYQDSLTEELSLNGLTLRDLYREFIVLAKTKI